MFKLIVLTALFALAAAKPGFLHGAAPLLAAPVTKIVQPAPLLVSEPAHVGSVVSSIPTGVSAHSSSVVHSHGAVVTPVVTPIQKTIIAPAPIVHSAPIVKTYAPYAPLSYAAPYAHAPLAYSAPAYSYSPYAASYSAPLAHAYAAPHALW